MRGYGWSIEKSPKLGQSNTFNVYGPNCAAATPCCASAPCCLFFYWHLAPKSRWLFIFFFLSPLVCRLTFTVSISTLDIINLFLQFPTSLISRFSNRNLPSFSIELVQVQLHIFFVVKQVGSCEPCIVFQISCIHYKYHLPYNFLSLF